MKQLIKVATQALVLTALLALVACGQERRAADAAQGPTPAGPGSAVALRGVSSYTPYDALAMLWARQAVGREMLWVNSGADAGRALVSNANPTQRPDWALASQGVAAGLAARGEDVVIIATVYNADDALLPIYRKPRRPLAGSKSLFIPRSSIEIAFDQLLRREGVAREAVLVPKVEKADFSTITSLLSKPSDDPNALDFAILVEPFVTNLLSERPNAYEVGEPGIYNLHYSVIVRRDDLMRRRSAYVALLRDFERADVSLAALGDDAYFRELWGRTKGNEAERLPRLRTYRRDAAGLRLDGGAVRRDVLREIEYLVGRYPADLRMPANPAALVDESLLKEIAPERVR